MEIALLQKAVIPNLWAEYKKTKEYKSGATEAIPPEHPIIIRREKDGLTLIYKQFGRRLRKGGDIKKLFVEMNVGDWIAEWKGLHNSLFKYVLKERGMWREKEVRFGPPDAEELFKIPNSKKVPSEIAILAHFIMGELEKRRISIGEKVETLAQFHYQFIRIHPFFDGNGRIARAITDKFAVFFGLPVAMAGYPRHNKNKRTQYHEAIKACAYDNKCKDLASWIYSYIEPQLDKLA